MQEGNGLLAIEEFEVVDLAPNGSQEQSQQRKLRRRRWKWVRIGAIVLLLGALSVAFAIWVLPLLLDKVVIPVLSWVASSFKKHQLALVLIAVLSFFPVFLIPSGPPMWLAGIVFGYGVGFCIIMAGTTVGQALPYFVGHYLFHQRIQQWLERWPRKALVLRAAEAGSCFFQFRTVTLLRVCPIPYTLFNYAITATKIGFWPYIAGSVAGMIPEAFITIYSGRLLNNLAEAKHTKRHMNRVEIAYNIVGFCVAIGAIVLLTAYGRKAMEELELKGGSESVATAELPHRFAELRRLGSSTGFATTTNTQA